MWYLRFVSPPLRVSRTCNQCFVIPPELWLAALSPELGGIC